MGDVDFVERMKRAPDEELIWVVSSDGFRPEAVEAAQAELQRRNVDPNEFTRIKGQVREARQEEANKAELPLSTTAKLAFLAFGVFIFWSIAAAVLLRTRGYERKGRDALKWILGSFIFWVLPGMIINFIAG